MTELAEPLVVITLRALIFPFGVFAGYFVAWGLVFVMDAVVRAFFGNLTSAIGWVPFVNRVVQQPVLAIEHKLTSYLGGLERHFENQMATRWHRFAGLMEQRNANAIRGAVIVYHVAAKLNTLWGNWATGGLMKDSHKAAKHADAHAAAAQHAATTAGKTAHVAHAATAGSVVTTTPATQVIVRTYPAGRLGTRVRAAESAIAGVIDYDLPGLRARDRAISDSLGRLWKRVRAERKTIGIGVFTGLLVTALGRLGLGRLHCLNRKNALKTVCGMNPNLLEALLTGTVVVGGSISIVKLAEACQEITGACEDGLAFFVRELK